MMLTPLTKSDPQAVPALLRNSLYAMLLVAGAASVPFIGQYGPLPTTVMLDVWLAVFAIASVLRGRIAPAASATALLLVAYLFSRIVGVLATDSPVYDAAQAYRWILYLIVFTLAVGRHWGPVRSLVAVTWALLSMALLKSALTLVIVGPGERPGLLLENNFEIALFSGLVAILYPHLKRPWLALLALGTIVALSGSRSGAIAFVVLVLFAFGQARGMNLFFRYLTSLGIVGVGVAVYWVFEQRAESVTQVDRLNFLDVFFNEVREWSPLEWLFGTAPITPLSPGGCGRLAYYATLFSSEGDGSCYSVILHAFAMRVIFDAGLVGLMISILIPLVLMRIAGVHRGLAMTLIAIAIANGLSVSGLNNPYVALPLLLSILVASRHPGEQSIEARTTPLSAGSPSKVTRLRT